jgi:methionyl aminopeptidase
LQNHLSYTPSYNDTTLANGLLKVDLGVHVNGWLADTAFSLDLENSEENKKLITTSEKALQNAIKTIETKIQLNKIGKIIQDTIEAEGFSPVINLSGHEMKQYDLHAGITVPNIDDKKNITLKKGLYAIEPFVTAGNGKVHDGKPSGIYMLIDNKNIRSSGARKILEFIETEYQTLPFCSRWIVKKFGATALFYLRQLESNGNLHHFAQLVETSHSNVAQTEDTILVEEKTIITTR